MPATVIDDLVPQKVMRLPECIAEFVSSCQRARIHADWPERVAEHLRALIADRALVAAAVRATFAEGRNIYYHTSDTLTIYPMLGDGGWRGPPHTHAARAVVGLIEGVEQYKLYREQGARVIETGVQVVEAPHVAIFEHDIIHALWSEPEQTGLSIHVYGNGHFHEPRRALWHPRTGERRSFDLDAQTRWTRELTAEARAW